jgi:Transposase IS116/IS110/IS902 family
VAGGFDETSYRTAEVIAAELGRDMTRFPSAGHAASSTGLCPGNHESAGKRLSGRTRSPTVPSFPAVLDALPMRARGGYQEAVTISHGPSVPIGVMRPPMWCRW